MLNQFTMTLPVWGWILFWVAVAAGAVLTGAGGLALGRYVFPKRRVASAERGPSSPSLASTSTARTRAGKEDSTMAISQAQSQELTGKLTRAAALLERASKALEAKDARIKELEAQAAGLQKAQQDTATQVAKAADPLDKAMDDLEGRLSEPPP